jgi:hypothetical protein
MREYFVCWQRENISGDRAFQEWFGDDPGDHQDSQGNNLPSYKRYLACPNKNQLLQLLNYQLVIPANSPTNYIYGWPLWTAFGMADSKEQLYDLYRVIDARGWYDRRQTGHLVWDVGPFKG